MKNIKNSSFNGVFNSSFDGSFDGSFITLRELRELVNGTSGQKLPTPNGLRESDARVVAQTAVGQDGELTVYENGFFTYKTALGSTVYAVDRCGDYIYDGGDVLDAASFEDEVWTVRLMLAGEDRLEHNNNFREESNHYSYSSDTVEQEDLRDPYDFVARLENRDLVDQMMACLTDKQRQVVELYFMEGMTQEGIQDLLGISRGAFLDRLSGAKKKLNTFCFDPVKTPPPACVK